LFSGTLGSVIAKKTSKNQITLPKKVVERFPDAEYFEVTAEGGRIVLRPVDLDALGRVRRKLARLGISEADVAGAVRWARRRGR
jgi:bifunctional DNA-binding transcriptional regulator/antitoxin component of YhaV-PrlF toxin-antitoxin module